MGYFFPTVPPAKVGPYGRHYDYQLDLVTSRGVTYGLILIVLGGSRFAPAL